MTPPTNTSTTADGNGPPSLKRRPSRSQVVFVAGLAFSIMLAVLAWWLVDRADRDAVASEVDVLGSAIVDRINTQTNGLAGLRAAALLNQPFDRDEFEAIVREGRRAGLYERTIAVAFAEPLLDSGRAAYERSLQAETGLDAVIHPESSPPYYPITYIDPVAGNELALGFDLGSEPRRRAAVEEARDRGDVVATPPLKLVQDDAEATGLLLMMAVYDTGDVPTTVPSRRRHFVGIVDVALSSPVLLTELIREESGLGARILDIGPTVAEPSLSNAQFVYATPEFREPTSAGRDDWAIDLNIGDRRWRVDVTREPRGILATIGTIPWLVLLAGLAFSAWAASVQGAAELARRRAETIAEGMTHELRESHERLSDLVDGAPDATLLVGSDGGIQRASRRVTELLGYDPQDLVGLAASEVVPGLFRGEAGVGRHGFHDAADAAGDMGAPRELDAMRHDGSRVSVEISLSRVGQGAFLASLRDASERRRASQALHDSLEAEQLAAHELRETERMRNTFLASVSHELRTPLTSILGFSSLARGSVEELPGHLGDYMERIERNAGTLLGLINELLEFTSLERGELTLNPELLDLRTLIPELVADQAQTLETHTVNVNITLPTQVVADRLSVTRILTNLLSNATRYSPHGTTITIEAGQRAADAWLSVSDQGAGVAVEDRERIFERFHRGSGEAELRIRGTGIGLSMVRDIAELHGGSVELTHTAAGGAKFTVRLPRTGPVPSDAKRL